MNWSVIVAGGNGERMKTSVNKIFLKIGKKPIIAWTIKAFEKNPLIDHIMLLVRKEDLATVNKIVAKEKFKKIKKILVADKNRQLSGYKAINWLKTKAKRDDLVGIHNAVNPFMSEKEIIDVYMAAEKHGSALLAQPAKDTIKIIDAQQIVRQTPPRQQCWQAQTPQVAKYHLLSKAFNKAKVDNFIGTDDTQLLERIGIFPKTVICSNFNIKITYYEDLIFARQIFKNYRLKKNYV